MLIISLLTIILIIFIIYNYNKKKRIEGLYTFNGRMAQDLQYQHDTLFDNVLYFPNTYAKSYESAEEIGKLLETGWDRCNRECPGRCTEYGQTNIAYCWLPQYNWTT